MAVLPPFGNAAFSPWLDVPGRAGIGTSSILTGLTSFSFEFLYNPKESPGAGVLWQAGGQGIFPPASTPSARWSVTAGLLIQLDNPTDGGPTLTSTSVLGMGVWRHVCATYDEPSGDLQLIINGVLEDSATSGVPWVTRATWIQPSSYAPGYYADTRLWDYARTPAEVTADYQAPLTGTESGLLAYWPGTGAATITNVVDPLKSNMSQIGIPWNWVYYTAPTPDVDTAPPDNPHETAIANAALIILGERMIGSLEESSEVARILLDRFDDVFDEALRIVPWNFAKRRTSLPADAVPPKWGYARSYTIPSDCVRLIDVHDETRFPWKLEGRRIVTSIPAPLPIEYIARVDLDDETDTLFKSVLSAMLAAEVAEAITGSTEKMLHAIDRLSDLTEIARTVNGQENSPRYSAPLSFERSRGLEDAR